MIQITMFFVIWIFRCISPQIIVEFNNFYMINISLFLFVLWLHPNSIFRFDIFLRSFEILRQDVLYLNVSLHLFFRDPLNDIILVPIIYNWKEFLLSLPRFCCCSKNGIMFDFSYIQFSIHINTLFHVSYVYFLGTCYTKQKDRRLLNYHIWISFFFTFYIDMFPQNVLKWRRGMSWSAINISVVVEWIPR